MRSQLKILAVLAIVLFAVIAYAFIPQNEDSELTFRKISLAALQDDEMEEVEMSDTLSGEIEDTMEIQQVDTTKQNILLFGDSMIERLARPFASYCEANGHEFNSVCWYSSTSRQWAKTDTLQYFINKFNPTYIMVCLGGNELFVRDIEDRERNVKKILSVIGNRPYVWIGTPNWKPDTGIGEIHRKLVGMDRYYESDKLTLKRSSDGAHPTFEAAEGWMDSVAVWIRSFQNRHPIVFEKYTEKAKDKHMTILAPMAM